MRHLLLAVLLAWPVLGQAQEPVVRAENSFARATAPRQTVGAAYTTLTSMADDRLLSASSPEAGRVELHDTAMAGDVMRMREMDGVALPAGQPVVFKPGGQHMMLVDLKQPLVAGQAITVRLVFQTAPPMDVRVQVAPIGAQGPVAPIGAQGPDTPAGAQGPAAPAMRGHAH